MITRNQTQYGKQIKNKILLMLLFSVFFVPLFSQPTDTVVDSRQPWIYFQNKFRNEYFDSSKHHFSRYQKQLIEQLINTKLALVDVVYIGFDNRIHAGQLICNQFVAADIKKIFLELLQLRFPVYQCKPISEFDFIDTKSMENNNATCFDFRLKTGSRNISKHSYGLAIDINPVENPYKKGQQILPVNVNESVPAGRLRLTDEQGKQVIAIFKKYGWAWGGSWRSLKDFMHFEKG